MRRAACRSKLKSPCVPPSRPTLTMRPLTLVAFDSGSRPGLNLVDDQVDAFTAGSLEHLMTQPESLESTARSAPNSFRRPRRIASVEEPITSFAP